LIDSLSTYSTRWLVSNIWKNILINVPTFIELVIHNRNINLLLLIHWFALKSSWPVNFFFDDVRKLCFKSSFFRLRMLVIWSNVHYLLTIVFFKTFLTSNWSCWLNSLYFDFVRRLRISFKLKSIYSKLLLNFSIKYLFCFNLFFDQSISFDLLFHLDLRLFFFFNIIYLLCNFS